MKMFTRLTAFFTAALMLLAALPALAAPGDGVIFRQEDADFGFNNMAYYDGVVYLSDYGENIYSWNSETGEMVAHPIPEELSQYEGDVYTSYRRLISGDDGLYLLYELRTNDEDGDSAFEKMLLYRVSAENGETTFNAEPIEMSWDDLVEEYDDYSYARDLSQAYIKDGKLIGQTYNSAGNSVVAVVDIEDDDVELVEAEYMTGMCAYTEGKVLISLRDYTGDDSEVSVAVLDLDSGDMEELAALETIGWSSPSGMVYDEETDTLYYALNGELYRAVHLDFSAAESIAALNVDSWSDSPAILTEDKYYVCSDYQTVIIRNTDPAQRSDKSITVYTGYSEAMEQAYYDFTAANPDVEVVQINNYEDITQAMMNQSTAVDVYVVSVDSQEYGAIFKRGYMAELNDSEIISGFVGSTYPQLQKVLVNDSGVVAVPIEMWTNCMCYNPLAFEALGLTEDDVPTSWPEFLALLQRLPEIIGDSGVPVVDLYYTQGELKSTLFYQIINDYMLYLQQDGVEFAFNTDVLRNVLTELDKVDFAALGLPEDYEDVDGVYTISDEAETGPLFNTYSDVTCESYAYVQKNSRPMPMAMEADGQPIIRTNLTVAFVNPYSENRELAIEYLECAVNRIEPVMCTNMCPDRSEPVENSYFQEALDSIDESIASIEEEMAKAEDDQTREEWQQQLDDMTQWRAEYEQSYRWTASPESIEFYRGYAQYIVPSQYIGFDDEASQEFYSLISQYEEGAIDLDTFLTNIDKKIRMMVLEDM